MSRAWRCLPLAASALLACAAASTDEPRPIPDASASTTGQAPAAPRVQPPPVAGSRPYFAHARFEAVSNARGEPAGVRVVSVAKGGRVHRLGLRGGDLMLRINGQPLTEKTTFGEAVALAERAFLGAEKLTVKLLRDGETFSLAELGPARAGPPEPKAPGTGDAVPHPKP